MKKKILVLTIALAMGLAVAACSDGGSKEETKKTENTGEEKKDTTDNKNQPEENKEEKKGGKVEQINIETEEGTFVYGRHELTTDFEGHPAIRIYFTYTNLKAEPQSALTAFIPTVFQNGVECDPAVVMDNNEAQGNNAKQVTTGTSIEIAICYKLQDNQNPVTLSVGDMSMLLDGTKQEQELALQ